MTLPTPVDPMPESAVPAPALPAGRYGVFAGRVLDTRREGGRDTPHYQVHLVDDSGVHARLAVNVQSQQSPSELLYLVQDDFRHPITSRLPAAGSGWASLLPGAEGAHLDYVRGNLFDHYLRRAAGDATIAVYALGASWGPEPSADKIFGFTPGRGVHDIHMNQGNSAAFARDDGVWQDGGLLLHLTGENRWVAIFLAFQSQSWHTDDVTGHAIPDAPPRPTPGSEPVRIIAALVNPSGPAPEAETVTMLNASPTPVDLSGWSIVDRAGGHAPLPAGQLAPGAVLVLTPGAAVALGNRGGTITLLDAAGLKVHGVAYTADQARQEGWTLTF